MPRLSVAYVSPPGAESAQALAHGLELVEVVAERDEASTAGLRDALALIPGATADTLFLPQLEAAARSLPELLRLLDWLEQADADLVAVQPALDTASEQGRATVAVLREIERWEREPSAPRRPRGRPSLTAGSPKLATRIGEMRERGMSLRAIADQLNRDVVSTPRGPRPGGPPQPPPHGGPPPPHRKQKP